MPVAVSGSYKMFNKGGIPSWVNSPSILNNPRMEFGSAGDEDNALIYGGLGGESTGIVCQFTLNCTEEWNGSSWSTVDPLSANVAGNAGFGTANAALSTGGASDTYNSNVISLLNGVITSEGYNGASWSTADSTNNTARWFRRGTGTQNAGTIVGGHDQDNGRSCGEVEWYDGISWSSRPNLRSNVALNVLVGEQSQEFSFGGACRASYGNISSFCDQTNQKSINGISWSATPRLNTNRVGLSGVGTQNAAIAIGGGKDYISLKCTEEWNGLTWSNIGDNFILPDFRNGSKTIGTLESIPINANSSLTVVGGSTKQHFPDLPATGSQVNYINVTSSEDTDSISFGLEEGGSTGNPTNFNTQITDSTASIYDTTYASDINTIADVSESLQWRNYPVQEQCIVSASFEEIFYPGGNENKYEITFTVDKIDDNASGSILALYSQITSSWVAQANNRIYGSADGTNWYSLGLNNIDINSYNMVATGNGKILISTSIASTQENLINNFTTNTGLPSGALTFSYSKYYNYFIANAGNYAYTSSNGTDWGQAGLIDSTEIGSGHLNVAQAGIFGHDDNGNIILSQPLNIYYFSQDGGVTWGLGKPSTQGSMNNNGNAERIIYSNEKWFWLNIRTGIYETSNPFVDFYTAPFAQAPWTSSYNLPLSFEATSALIASGSKIVFANNGTTTFLTGSINPSSSSLSSWSSVDSLTSSMGSSGFTSGHVDDKEGFMVVGDGFTYTSSNGTDWGSGSTLGSSLFLTNTKLGQETIPPNSINSQFITITGSEGQIITGSAFIGPNSTFVGWSSTPVFNVPRIFRKFKPLFNIIETSTNLVVTASNDSPNQNYWAVFDFDVIEKKYCYTTSSNRNDICLECQEEKTIYFNKTNYENTGSEGITWYEDINLSTTASDGYYYLSGSNNPIVYDLMTGSAEFELICDGDVIYCS